MVFADVLTENETNPAYVSQQQQDRQDSESKRERTLEDLIGLYLGEGKSPQEIFGLMMNEYPELTISKIIQIKARLFAAGKIHLKETSEQKIGMNLTPMQQPSFRPTLSTEMKATYEDLIGLRGKAEADKWLDRQLGLGEVGEGPSLTKQIENAVMQRALGQMLGGGMDNAALLENQRRSSMGFGQYPYPPQITGNPVIDTYSQSLPVIDKQLTLLNDSIRRGMGLGDGISREDRAKIQQFDELQLQYKQCPKCSTLNPRDAITCVQCGAKFVITQAQHQQELMQEKRELEERLDRQLSAERREFSQTLKDVQETLSKVQQNQQLGGHYPPQQQNQQPPPQYQPPVRQPYQPPVRHNTVPQQGGDVLMNYSAPAPAPLSQMEQADINSMIDLSSRLVNVYEDGMDSYQFLNNMFSAGSDEEKKMLCYMVEKSGQFVNIGRTMFQNLRGYSPEVTRILKAMDDGKFVTWLDDGASALKSFIEGDFMKRRNAPNSTRPFIWNESERTRVKSTVDATIQATEKYKQSRGA